MDIKDVESLAELAKIELSLDEKKAILKDMEGILAYVKQIESVDVKEVEIKHKLYNIWREDLLASLGLKESIIFSKQFITEQFPEAQDGFLKVKKIL